MSYEIFKREALAERWNLSLLSALGSGFSKLEILELMEVGKVSEAKNKLEEQLGVESAAVEVFMAEPNLSSSENTERYADYKERLEKYYESQQL